MTIRRLLVPAAATLVLVACATTKDYQKEAADFIESGTVAKQFGITFTGATCERPGTVEVGTEFSCTATGSDGVSYRFVVDISDEKEFTLNAPQPVG